MSEKSEPVTRGQLLAAFINVDFALYEDARRVGRGQPSSFQTDQEHAEKVQLRSDMAEKLRELGVHVRIS